MNRFFLLLVIQFSFLAVDAQPPEPRFLSAERTANGLAINTSEGQIRIIPYSHHALEVEFVSTVSENPPSYAIAAPPAKLKTTLEENELYLQYATQGIAVQINKDPFHISYHFGDRLLFSEADGYFDNDTEKGFSFYLSQGEKLMGGGERVLGMDRRGKRLRLYNNPSYGYETHAELMYYSLPVVISSKKYMLAFDNGADGYLDLGAAEFDVLRFGAAGGRMSYLVVAADHWDQLAEQFTALTGRQPLPPRWTMGNISSRMGYHSQQEVEEVVDKFIADDIPLDAIVLDLFWFGKEVKGTLGNLEWYADSFPQPEKMMAGLKEKGVKTVLITEPFILRSTLKYPEVIEKGLVATDTSGQPYHYDFYFGNTTLLDIFKPETRQWFWDIYKKHTLSGADGWWGDLGEPERHPDDIVHVNGRGNEVHNLYGHVWAQTIFDGYAKDFPTRRPVILMRSGFAGSQRYGMIPWSGDVNRTWGGLKPQVEIALSMGLQGLAYMHSDLGGFAGNYEDAELYTRWLQYGVFQPVFRTHAQEGVPAEPVFWDEATKDIVRRYIKLRYRLLPYNYTLAWENTTKGTPMMRPLFYVDDDPALLDNTTTYLWGDNFLVSPVVEKGATTQKVYFPKNACWFDFWTGKAYEGGQEAEVPVGINDIPVFVKAGAFIPMAPEMQSTKDYSSTHLILHYYHDDSVSSSEGYVYEDDGQTKNGGYELIRFKAENGEALAIDIQSNGSKYAGKPKERTVELVIHNLAKEPAISASSPNPLETMWNEEARTFTVKATLQKGIRMTFE
jgi:oligosaccharide 4-alpha-D-glucosyltransferase